MKNGYFAFARILSLRLLGWSLLSLFSGVWLMRRDHPFWRGVGLHFAGWGGIDGLIALFGLVGNRRTAASEQAADPDFVDKEAQKLKLILWVNAGLDVLYVLGGGWLYRRKGKTDPLWRGQGVGVIIQGGFLLLFDVWHALKMGEGKRE